MKFSYRNLLIWLRPFIYLLIIAIIVIFIPYFLGKIMGLGRVTDDDWIGLLPNIPEVFAGVLGITITVVAIIVELAANRYTAKITELFFLSKINYIIMGFFVVATIQCVWVTIEGATILSFSITLINITLALLLILPYFSFVFNFLNPHNVISRIKEEALKNILDVKGISPKVDESKIKTIECIEQITDVALNAISNKDKAVSMAGVNALSELGLNYIKIKDKLNDNWFMITKLISENPDFISMTDDVLKDIQDKKEWLEMKIFRQYQMIYTEALNKMRDINYLVGINTKEIGIYALNADNKPIFDLTIKFFNTYLRSTINSKDVRTAYNILNQYRLLAEYAMKNKSWEDVENISHYFKYYGQLAFAQGIPFILETAAYDLCYLCELAYNSEAPNLSKIINIFLDIDKESEDPHEFESTLRGVRKAQIKLATYFLLKGEESLARQIYLDMKNEPGPRLNSIKNELISITTKDFWEIIDRGINFDFLEPSRREQLDKFFSWFEN